MVQAPEYVYYQHFWMLMLWRYQWIQQFVTFVYRHHAIQDHLSLFPFKNHWRTLFFLFSTTVACFVFFFFPLSFFFSLFFLFFCHTLRCIHESLSILELFPTMKEIEEFRYAGCTLLHLMAAFNSPRILEYFLLLSLIPSIDLIDPWWNNDSLFYSMMWVPAYKRNIEAFFRAFLRVWISYWRWKPIMQGYLWTSKLYCKAQEKELKSPAWHSSTLKLENAQHTHTHLLTEHPTATVPRLTATHYHIFSTCAL